MFDEGPSIEQGSVKNTPALIPGNAPRSPGSCQKCGASVVTSFLSPTDVLFRMGALIGRAGCNEHRWHGAESGCVATCARPRQRTQDLLELTPPTNSQWQPTETTVLSTINIGRTNSTANSASAPHGDCMTHMQPMRNLGCTPGANNRHEVKRSGLKHGHLLDTARAAWILSLGRPPEHPPRIGSQIRRGLLATEEGPNKERAPDGPRPELRTAPSRPPPSRSTSCNISWGCPPALPNRIMTFEQDAAHMSKLDHVVPSSAGGPVPTSSLHNAAYSRHPGAATHTTPSCHTRAGERREVLCAQTLRKPLWNE